MPYVITITEKKVVTVKAGKEWARTSAEANAPYAYTPEIEKDVERETEVLKQTVGELDMAAVIKAINRL